MGTRTNGSEADSVIFAESYSFEGAKEMCQLHVWPLLVLMRMEDPSTSNVIFDMVSDKWLSFSQARHSPDARLNSQIPWLTSATRVPSGDNAIKLEYKYTFLTRL
jgi:hypothetical protein